jgi:hypothetical protein
VVFRGRYANVYLSESYELRPLEDVFEPAVVEIGAPRMDVDEVSSHVELLAKHGERAFVLFGRDDEVHVAIWTEATLGVVACDCPPFDQEDVDTSVAENGESLLDSSFVEGRKKYRGSIEALNLGGRGAGFQRGTANPAPYQSRGPRFAEERSDVAQLAR